MSISGRGYDRESDQKWHEQWFPQIRQLIEQRIGETLKMNHPVGHMAKLRVLTGEKTGADYACRIRDSKYINVDDFTFREMWRHNRNTELAWLMDELYPPHQFYGFTDVAETCIPQWFVFDTSLFRAHLDKVGGLDGAIARGQAQRREQKDGLGTTYGVFDIAAFGPGFVQFGSRHYARYEPGYVDPDRAAAAAIAGTWLDLDHWCQRIGDGTTLAERRASLGQWVQAAGGRTDETTIHLPIDLKRGLALARLKAHARGLYLTIVEDIGT